MRTESIRVTAVVGSSLTFIATLLVSTSPSSELLPKFDLKESKLPGDPTGDGGNSESSKIGLSLTDSTSD